MMVFLAYCEFVMILVLFWGVGDYFVDQGYARLLKSRLREASSCTPLISEREKYF